MDVILRITRLVQRSLDDEAAYVIGRCGAADFMVAFDEKRLAAPLGNERSRCQPTKSAADNDNIIVVSHTLDFIAVGEYQALEPRAWRWINQLPRTP